MELSTADYGLSTALTLDSLTLNGQFSKRATLPLYRFWLGIKITAIIKSSWTLSLKITNRDEWLLEIIMFPFHKRTNIEERYTMLSYLQFLNLRSGKKLCERNTQRYYWGIPRTKRSVQTIMELLFPWRHFPPQTIFLSTQSDRHRR